MDSDEELLQRIKSGAVDDFRLLVEKYHRHLLNFIYGIVWDNAIVEDIGQDVFLAAYLSLKDFDESRGTPFSAWLFTIARNRCISEMRKKARRKIVVRHDVDSLPDATGDQEKELAHARQRHALEKSVGLLPEPFKSVLLDSMNGATIRQSAKLFQVSENTVKTRLFRAREKLKQLLGTRKGSCQ